MFYQCISWLLNVREKFDQLLGFGPLRQKTDTNKAEKRDRQRKKDDGNAEGISLNHLIWRQNLD